jgi:formylglycine-generating enzyme required for sulfatase activity
LDISKNIEVKKGVKNTFSFVLTKNVGNLELKIEPKDAVVKINKETISLTNKPIELTPGSYLLEIEKEGYYGISEVIKIELRKTIKKSYKLKEKRGDLQFSINPYKTKVKLKSKGKEIANWEGLKIINGLQVGNYEIEAKVSGYKTYKKGITIKENETTKINAIMEKGSDFSNNLVFVKGGTFRMGNNNGENDEKPVHTVTVNDFYIGKYEVTQKEWKDIMGNNPSYFKGKNRPVENVSWYDAISFCNKLSEEKGLTKFYTIDGTNVTMNWGANGYRLPTEAEWEYAARGGQLSKGYKYSGSNDIDAVAWYDGNSGNKTHAVGTKQPNELGIYDMSGNVWEWSNDWYSDNYYSSSPSNNPQGPSTGSSRVIRGGSWYFDADYCRATYRFSVSPGLSYGFIGFRLARTP